MGESKLAILEHLTTIPGAYFQAVSQMIFEMDTKKTRPNFFRWHLKRLVELGLAERGPDAHYIAGRSEQSYRITNAGRAAIAKAKGGDT